MKTYCTTTWQFDGQATIAYCGTVFKESSNFRLTDGCMCANVHVWENGQIVDCYYWDHNKNEWEHLGY